MNLKKFAQEWGEISPHSLFNFSIYLLLISAIVILPFLLFQKIYYYDIWWHLAAGKWILQHKNVPIYDPFSFTFSQHKWLDSQWLFQLLIYKIYTYFGYTGLIFFTGFTSLIFLLVLYKALKSWKVSSKEALLLVCLVLFVSSSRFMLRPHLFSFLFVAIFLWLIGKFRQDPSWKSLILIVIFYILWVNIHGSFIIGALLVGIYFLEIATKYSHLNINESLKKEDVKKSIILCILIAASSLINPYHWRLLWFVLFSHRGEGADALRFIGEWLPYNWKNLFLPSWNQDLFFKIIFWLFITALILNIKKINRKYYIWTLWSGFLFYLTLKHHRFSALFVTGSAPFIGFLWSKIENKFKYYLFALIALISTIYPITYLKNPINRESAGFSVRWELYPTDNTLLIKKNQFEGKMFNKYSWGGFLIWHLYPQYKVFIDGRTPSLYSSNFYWLYRISSLYPQDALPEIISRWDLSFFIISKKAKKLANYLLENQNYVLVSFDDVSWLLAKREIVRDLDYLKIFRPGIDIKEFIKKAQEDEIKELKKELLNVAQKSKYSISAYIYLAELESSLKRYKESEKFLLKALEKNINKTIIFKNLGIIYYNMEKFKKSYHYLDLANKRKKEDPEIIKYLAYSSYHVGKVDLTFSLMKKYFQYKGDPEDAHDYQYFALACYEKNKFKEAIDYFQRCLFLAKDKSLKVTTYYNLGNCYLALQKWQLASIYYKKALALDPHYKPALKALEEIEAFKEKNS